MLKDVYCAVKKTSFIRSSIHSCLGQPWKAIFMPIGSLDTGAAAYQPSPPPYLCLSMTHTASIHIHSAALVRQDQTYLHFIPTNKSC